MRRLCTRLFLLVTIKGVLLLSTTTSSSKDEGVLGRREKNLKQNEPRSVVDCHHNGTVSLRAVVVDTARTQQQQQQQQQQHPRKSPTNQGKEERKKRDINYPTIVDRHLFLFVLQQRRTSFYITSDR